MRVIVGVVLVPSLRQYHIFISHSWDYDSQYQTIRGWLDRSSYFSCSDYSVPITRPVDAAGNRALKEKLGNRIAVSSCVLVLSGMYAAYSDWIDYEIDTALYYRKPIIGVRPWGQERVPIKVQNSATVMVGWNTSSVIDAIRRFAL